MRGQSYVKITPGAAADQIEYKYYLGVAPPPPNFRYVGIVGSLAKVLKRR